ncbi:MAG: MopE-related protein [Pseudomonadota bacterium]|nr:MopE-related protein [Pseudomonadota bacterium]
MRSTFTFLLLFNHLNDCAGRDRTDSDGDGRDTEHDCNDSDPTIGAKRPLYDDADGDGYGSPVRSIFAQNLGDRCSAPAGFVFNAEDCNDRDAAFHPGADETDCADTADYNCDDSVGGTDGDADGFGSCEDCDDADASVNPDAVEVCNEQDDDCDGDIDVGATDASIWHEDADGDGFGSSSSAKEACAQPDQYVADDTDCQDASAAIHPGAEETCNNLDDDCDGDIDGDATDATAWYPDADGDGWGASGATQAACTQPDGYSLYGDDCDDTHARYYPGADESDCADTHDYNCDGSTGGGDLDADGYAACDDCDDGDAGINPDATELCNGADDDCDGTVDEPDALDASTWYADADTDGYGGATAAVACSRPSGHLSAFTDCDDADSSIHPDGVEVCDASDTDEDCDGESEEDGAKDAATWYEDADGDGFGSSVAVTACSEPAGYVTAADDCDDTDAAYNPAALEPDCADPNDYNCDGYTGYADLDADGWAACDECDDGNASINPDATELCNGADDDCDGDADGGAVDSLEWYEDGDGDGFGSSLVVSACSAPVGFVAVDGDCDDGTGAVNPVAVERCDLGDTDENCDGLADDATATGGESWYVDGDADGFGAGVASLACDAPVGSAASSDDCNDASASAHPGAPELVNNGGDEDCDGFDACYLDSDRDGYGTTTVIDSDDLDCADAGESGVVTDCDDASASDYPGAAEVCDDGIDQDCDLLDDVCPGTVTTLDGIDFIRVAASTFDMGCTPGQSSCADDETLHTVTLTQDYYVSETEVTQAQFEETMGYNPSYFTGCGVDCPVEGVSWYESAAYANALSSAAGLTSCYTCTGSGASVSCSPAMDPYACDGYRLLTEAEWEGAARCGEDLLYAGSVTVGDVAWYISNAGSTTHAVAGLDPNSCGLYDMSGNVWEWTQDWYGALSPSAATDPVGAASSSYCVLRGGSGFNAASHARVAARVIGSPNYVGNNIGFRLARSIP